MTIDRIRITTQEEANAVPPWSWTERPVGSFTERSAYGAKVGDTLTHIAIPVADAIEARRVLDSPMVMGPVASRRIADLILPPVLAEAAEQQAKPTIPDGLDAGLVRLLGSLNDDEWTALRAHAQGFVEYAAALDAEGGQG